MTWLSEMVFVIGPGNCLFLDDAVGRRMEAPWFSDRDRCSSEGVDDLDSVMESRRSEGSVRK